MEKFKQSNLLNQATKDSPEPAPGYLFNEIAKITFEGYKDSSALSDFLLKKAEKSKSPYVLQKTMKLIKMICEKGHPDFKKEMQRYVDTLKEVAAFRGKQDSVHGDKLNQAVRDAAQAAIESSFAASKSTLSNRDLSGQGANTVEKTKEAGFKTGVEISSAAQRSNKLAEHFGQAAPSVVQEGMASQLKSAFSTGFGALKPSEHEKMLTAVSAETNVEYVAPVAETSLSKGSSLQWGAAPAFKPPPVVECENDEDEDITTEEQILVKRMTEDCKTSTLGRTQLAEFLSKVREMDTTEICVALEERLDDKQHWQVRLRACSALEHLVSHGVADVTSYFADSPDLLVKCAEKAVQDSLKSKAKKVLHLLGVDPSKTQKSPPVARASIWANAVSAAEPEPAAESSLSFEGMTIKKTDKQPKSDGKVVLKKRKPKEADQPVSPSSLGIAGIAPQNASPPPAPAPAPVIDALDFLSFGEDHIAPSTSSGTPDLLDILDFSSPMPSNTPQNTPQHQFPPTASNFGFTSQPVTAPTSAFSFTNPSSGDSLVSNAAPTASGGDAMSFMEANLKGLDSFSSPVPTPPAPISVAPQQTLQTANPSGSPQMQMQMQMMMQQMMQQQQMQLSPLQQQQLMQQMMQSMGQPPGS